MLVYQESEDQESEESEDQESEESEDQESEESEDQESEEVLRFIEGGIYMASNVEQSCEVRDCKIVERKNETEIIGKLGCVEHLKGVLPSPIQLNANTMYWITDRTPHESLLLKNTTHRQFFRLGPGIICLFIC